MRRANPALIVGGILVGICLLAAIIGPFVAPYPADKQNIQHLLESPSTQHLLGTDENGCDVLSQMLYGARLDVLLSLIVVSLSVVIGTAIGVVAGYFGGWIDEIIMRVVDILLAFPGILLNLAIVAVVPAAGIGTFIFALLINGWVGYARLARGEALALREREFIVAARALGFGPWRIMLRHVVPSILSPIAVQATFGFGGVILVEATLSFLGIGRLRAYSWGSILAQGTTYLWRAVYLAVVPGLAIALVVFGANLLRDGLRDRLDPKRA